MKPVPSHLRLPALLIAALLIVMLSGCARTPSGIGIAPSRVIEVEMTLSAPVNEAYHYYMVIDTDGGGAGPMPVVIGDTPGQGWVTGSATHFVEYHRGQFTLYKFLSLGDFQYVRIGAPIRFSVSGNVISFAIDLSDLEATGESVDVNLITLDDPFDQHRTIDALITAGTSALNIDITRNDTIDNARLGFIEQPDDLLSNGIPAPSTDVTRPLDMIGWSIEVDI